MRDHRSASRSGGISSTRAKEYFGVEGLEALGSLGSLIISIIEETALEVTPVAGHIKDGYDVFTG